MANDRRDTPETDPGDLPSWSAVGATEVQAEDSEQLPGAGETEIVEAAVPLPAIAETEARDEDTARFYEAEQTEVHEAGGGETIVRAPDEPPRRQRAAGEHRVTGHYAIEERVGSGGFAEVYRAEDLRTGDTVAVKQLLPNVARSSEITSRFRAVAERTMQLRHPNIIAVLGTETVDGRLAIVMEYVTGVSLRNILTERQVLPVAEAMPLALQLCDALTYAHEHGFIHRDVKPENVMVTPQGAVKLGDFDIAKLTTSSAYTRVGARIGTAYYMSPEQLRGDEDVDVRSDVFSMGVVLYEMLTGCVPIGRFQHPSEVNPALPHRLGSVIFKALAFDRGVRYNTIRELRDALTGSPEARQTTEMPFHFRGGHVAHSLADLVELCEQDWDSARWHLLQGHFRLWLGVVDPEKARQIESTLADEADDDLELEKFVHMLDSSLPDPVLSVRPEFEIQLGDLAPLEYVTKELEVSNPSRGYLVGSASMDRPWITTDLSEFRLKEDQALKLHVLIQAPAAAGAHTGQITLRSNGGTIEIPISLVTSRRLLFPRAGRSAGTLDELVDLCQAHREEAVELFYDGQIERWLMEGPMLFHLVARSQELRERYGGSPDAETRGRGLWAFLLASRPGGIEQEPFSWRTGQSAKTVSELVALCEEDHTNAKWHLYEGHFATWLELVAPALVAEAERIRQTTQDQDLGLELFLHVLDPDLPNPSLEVEPATIDLQGIAPGERRQVAISIRNRGRGYLAGSLSVPSAPWLRLSGLGTSMQEMKGATLTCPRCSAKSPSGAKFCKACGGALAGVEATASKEELLAQQADHPPQRVSFGCLPSESCTFTVEATGPDEAGLKTVGLALESNGGKLLVPFALRAERRLLFPQTNVSAGTVPEMAQIASQHWAEARELWVTGRIREWLSRGLRRFDWVAIADDYSGRGHLPADMQLARFVLHVCPECKPLLPPCLEPSQPNADLGRVVNRSQAYLLRIDNLGGGTASGITVVDRPSWIETAWGAIDQRGAAIQLQAQTRHLKGTGPVEGTLVLSLRGHYGGAELEQQKISIPIRMSIAPSLRIGPLRIPFDGKARIGRHAVPVRALWVGTIGLVSLALGIVAGVLAKKAVWWLGVWLGLWLAGSLTYAFAGLTYRNPITLLRDLFHWLKRWLQSEELRSFFQSVGHGIQRAARAVAAGFQALVSKIRSGGGRR